MNVQLSEMIATLERERDKLTAAINYLSALDNSNGGPSVVALNPVAAAKGMSTKSKPKTAPATKRHRQGAASAEQIAICKLDYESGVPVEQIATKFNRTTSWVYQCASAGGWKRSVKVSPGPAKAAPEKLAGRVRCSSCAQLTETDPCQHCHKPLARTWTR